MVSRMPFAVWNTVAARPIVPVAIPNASAILGAEAVEVGSERGVPASGPAQAWTATRSVAPEEITEITFCRSTTPPLCAHQHPAAPLFNV